MNHNRPPFSGPYFDPTGLGFYRPRDDLSLHRRALSIMAICWNPTEREALFVNAAGHCVPLEPHPYELASALSRPARVEYGRVIGDGQFAMKPAALKALESSGRIRQWIVYWLWQPAGYADDEEVWAAHLARELEAASNRARATYAESLRFFSSQTADVSLLGIDANQHTPPALESEILQEVQQRRDELEKQRRSWLVEDARINAWLRGDCGHPPMLAIMQGAA